MSLFVRGADADTVLAAFGAADAPAALPAIAALGLPEHYRDLLVPTVHLGRHGEWLVISEELIPPQSVRPEVLRRLPAACEAVAVDYDLGKAQHSFGYAVGGYVVATLWAGYPPRWEGVDPGRFEVAARAVGLTADSDVDQEGWSAILAMIEEVVGLRIDTSSISIERGPIPVLPPLEDTLPPVAPYDRHFGTGEADLDALLAGADELRMRRVVTPRVRRLLATSGLHQHPELVAAVEAALAGATIAADGPADRTLRILTAERNAAELLISQVLNDAHTLEPVAPELDRIVAYGESAKLLRYPLGGRFWRAFVNDVHRERRLGSPTWHADALADLRS